MGMPGMPAPMEREDLDNCKVATATDGNTIKILKLAADEIEKKMKKRPHVIISNLRR